MKLVWTMDAANDFEEIIDHISKESPEAGRRVAKHVFEMIAKLPLTPLRGRKRQEDAGREIIFVPWPYVAVYEVVGDKLYVKAIRHTSRDWAH